MNTNNKSLTIGSLFDGSGGFPLGGKLAGIETLWASEIEPFPIAVTRKRFPNVKHYGDVSKINGAEVEPVDIITFGSPCQDLSLAGKRKGLVDGDRSSLFFQAIRIIKEMRNATNGLDNRPTSPRFIVWENVFGAFSSNKGEDFKKVLEEVCKVRDESVSIPRPKKWNGAECIMADGYSVAWRLFDAQYWGVPQRRRRIYLVADFDGQCAGDILFKSEGLSRNSTESRKPWERTSKNPQDFIRTEGFDGYNNAVTGDKSKTITSLSSDYHHVPISIYCFRKTAHPKSAEDGQGWEPTSKSDTLNVFDSTEQRTPTIVVKAYGESEMMMFDNHSQDTRFNGPLYKANTVTQQYGTGGNNQPLVVSSTPKTLKIRCGCEGGGKGALIQDNISATLGTNNDQTLFQPIEFDICSKESNSMKSDNPNSGFYKADTPRTLDLNGANPSCNQGGLAIVEKKDKNPVLTSSSNSFFTEVSEEIAYTLSARDYKDPPICCSHEEHYIVRRLTLTECARLQGFYDWWCDDISVENPTEEDMEFWRNVFETHRKIASNTSRPKSDRQIKKWLANPHSDSAEYKMWGNGVALPNAYYVLSSISRILSEQTN
jgi:DNA (cytosine-5)-methyltransferase 1